MIKYLIFHYSPLIATGESEQVTGIGIRHGLILRKLRHRLLIP